MSGEPLMLADFVVEGRVARNRLHGKGLLWIKVSIEVQDAADAEIAVVFDARTYPHDVPGVSKSLSLGDRGCFRGVLRSCGKIVDACSFTMFERTAEDDAWLERRASVSRQELAVCEPQANNGAELCKYWLSNGRCLKGRPCECAHPKGDSLTRARADYKEQLETRRRSAVLHPEDPHSGETKQLKSHRSSIFAQWLIDKFGMELLRRGVVDVAGGRGDLSFELSVKRGIPCTVVDARCHGEELAPCAWPDWQLSRGQRLWLQANVPGLRGFKACQAHVASCQLRQCRAVIESTWQEKRSRWAEVLAGAGIVVGMHPDQATGGAVELACEFELPFAVVPCCIFSDEFPDRMLGSGPDARCVRTHDDLVAWLQLCSPGSEKDFLNFRGKNCVVFRKATLEKGDTCAGGGSASEG
mmetsp:Transcript_96047/g.299104  ORF Transcript_96047/g.299104 Transcript_96047/m.299104 type:complete len:413 (+) Transcript_96047:107-1345(+)|eukprot:CAMPEP_0204590588 /NCGR_PEP_ID=MMETSP0661-20131031/49875_1 /ASSEMBLY_ACC=CAM_ASM_000606 /TAXON_ID=109239 /ORGANISM="Alexandrium margalefi, Strain AMGDE01CS-322" /LENGTH=412 /DNA_ID=CAMNT_0051600633 /DNA_START=105 /DNA_END=1343 /DNA_ORIENTATION=+